MRLSSRFTVGASAAAAALAALPGAATAAPVDPVAAARQALANQPGVAKFAAGDRFTLVDVITDPSGAAHVRMDRVHEGLPVLGGDVIVHLDAKGKATGITSAQRTDIDVATTPSITRDRASAAARAAVGSGAKVAGSPRLVVSAGADEPALAWEVAVETPAGAPGGAPSTVTVDARTGRVIDVIDEIHKATGTGKSIHSGTVPMETLSNTGGFGAVDLTSKLVVCQADSSLNVLCPITDADNNWTGPNGGPTATADASYAGAKTAQLFRTQLGRPTLLKDGGPIQIVLGLSDVRSNAAYIESNRRVLVWTGTTAGSVTPVQLDIVAHELSHAVTMDTARLKYSGESGGLNEATSDIFGTMVEFSAANSADAPDYLIAEKSNIRNDNKPLRWMYHPSLDGPYSLYGQPSPDCYSGAVAGLDPHLSSGPGNKFFYMLAEGSNGSYGTSPTCGAAAVTGIGRTDATRIWYKALTAYFTSTTGYQSAGSNDARAGTLSAAADLFGVCSRQYRAVQAAWTATAVQGEDLPCTGVFENGTNVNIADQATASSSITAQLQGGNAPTSTQVFVDIKHARRGDLQIDLVAPNGTKRRLKSASTTDTAANLFTIYTVNASSSPAAGTWRLEVKDTRTGVTGYLDRWSIAL